MIESLTDLIGLPSNKRSCSFRHSYTSFIYDVPQLVRVKFWMFEHSLKPVILIFVFLPILIKYYLEWAILNWEKISYWREEIRVYYLWGICSSHFSLQYDFRLIECLCIHQWWVLVPSSWLFLSIFWNFVSWATEVYTFLSLQISRLVHSVSFVGFRKSSGSF
jgi:hypothetical protein